MSTLRALAEKRYPDHADEWRQDAIALARGIDPDMCPYMGLSPEDEPCYRCDDRDECKPEGELKCKRLR